MHQALSDSSNYGAVSARHLMFNHKDADPGKGLILLEWDNGTADALDFTGQHRSITNNKDLYSSNFVGHIVSSTGNYKDLSSKYIK